MSVPIIAEKIHTRTNHHIRVCIFDKKQIVFLFIYKIFILQRRGYHVLRWTYFKKVQNLIANPICRMINTFCETLLRQHGNKTVFCNYQIRLGKVVLYVILANSISLLFIIIIHSFDIVVKRINCIQKCRIIPVVVASVMFGMTRLNNVNVSVLKV